MAKHDSSGFSRRTAMYRRRKQGPVRRFASTDRVDTASATVKRPLRARNPVRTTRSTYVNEASQPRVRQPLSHA